MTSGKYSPSLIPWEALKGTSYLSAREQAIQSQGTPGTTSHGHRATREGRVSSQAPLALQTGNITGKITPGQRQPSGESGRSQPLEVMHKETGSWGVGRQNGQE